MARTTGRLVCTQVHPGRDERAWDEWGTPSTSRALRDRVPARSGRQWPWAATRFELTTRPQPGMPGIGFTPVTIYELDDADPAATHARSPPPTPCAPTDASMPRTSPSAPTCSLRGTYGEQPEPSERASTGPHPDQRLVQRPQRGNRRSGTRGTTTNTCPTCSLRGVRRDVTLGADAA